MRFDIANLRTLILIAILALTANFTAIAGTPGTEAVTINNAFKSPAYRVLNSTVDFTGVSVIGLSGGGGTITIGAANSTTDYLTITSGTLTFSNPPNAADGLASYNHSGDLLIPGAIYPSSGPIWSNPGSRIIYDQYSEQAISTLSDSWNTDSTTTLISDPDYGYVAVNGSLFIRNSLQIQTFGGSTTIQLNADGSISTDNGAVHTDGSGDLTAVSFAGDASSLYFGGNTYSSTAFGTSLDLSGNTTVTGTVDGATIDLSGNTSYAPSMSVGNADNAINAFAATTAGASGSPPSVFFSGYNTLDSYGITNGANLDNIGSSVTYTGGLNLVGDEIATPTGTGFVQPSSHSDGTTPVNTVTPAAWRKESVDGTIYWVPLYQ